MDKTDTIASADADADEEEYSSLPTITLGARLERKKTFFSKINLSVTCFAACLLCILSLILPLYKAIIYDIPSVVINAAIFFPLLLTICFFIFKYKKTSILTLTLIFCWVLWLNRTSVYTGAMYVYRNFAIALNKFFNLGIKVPYAVLNRFSSEDSIAAVMIALIFLVSLLLCFLYSKGRGMIVTAILSAGSFWICFNLSSTQGFAVKMILLLSIFAAFTHYASFIYMKRGEDGFAKIGGRSKKKARFILLSNGKSATNSIYSMTAVFLAVLVIFCAVMAFTPQKTLERKAPLEEYGHDPQKLVVLLEDTLLNPMRDFFSFGRGMGIGGGMLVGGRNPNPTGATALKISMAENQPMHLKGYVGSVYETTNWSMLPQETYENASSVFNHFETFGFTPQTIFKPFLYTKQVGLGIQGMSIQNISANTDYLYTPYGTVGISAAKDGHDYEKYINDTIIGGSEMGKGIYNITKVVTPNIDTIEFRSLMEEAENNSNGNPYEREFLIEYNDFLLENYTALPETGVERIKAEAQTILDAFNIGEGLTDSDELMKNAKYPEMSQNPNVQRLVSLVVEYLHSHAVYDINPDPMPAGKDFAEFFLYESHKGFCTHFATAGTLLFRAMGVPARYVEGYVVTENDFVGKQSKEWFRIPDSNAHAWVEIWSGQSFDWEVVEVTPGFTGTSVASPVKNVEVPREMYELKNNPSSYMPSSSVSSDTAQGGASVSSELSNDTSSKEVELSPTQKREKELLDNIRTVILSVVITLLSIVCVIILSLLVLGSISSFASRKRKRLFRGEDTRKAVLAMYGYSLKLLAFIGRTPYKKESDKEYAQRVSMRIDIPFKHFTELTRLAVEAKFSDHVFETVNVSKLVELTEAAAKRLYEDEDFWKRLKFIFINML